MKKLANIPGNLMELDTVELYRAANTRLVSTGVSVAMIANDAGTRTARVYAYQDDDSGALTTITAIIAAQAKRGEALVLDRMTADAGYLPVKSPRVDDECDNTVIAAAVETMREAVAAIEIWSAAVADGIVTKDELGRVSEKIRRAQAVLAGLEQRAVVMQGGVQ